MADYRLQITDYTVWCKVGNRELAVFKGDSFEGTAVTTYNSFSLAIKIAGNHYKDHLRGLAASRRRPTS